MSKKPLSIRTIGVFSLLCYAFFFLLLLLIFPDYSYLSRYLRPKSLEAWFFYILALSLLAFSIVALVFIQRNGWSNERNKKNWKRRNQSMRYNSVVLIPLSRKFGRHSARWLYYDLLSFSKRKKWGELLWLHNKKGEGFTQVTKMNLYLSRDLAFLFCLRKAETL